MTRGSTRRRDLPRVEQHKHGHCHGQCQAIPFEDVLANLDKQQIEGAVLFAHMTFNFRSAIGLMLEHCRLFRQRTQRDTEREQVQTRVVLPAPLQLIMSSYSTSAGATAWSQTVDLLQAGPLVPKSEIWMLCPGLKHTIGHGMRTRLQRA